MDDFTGKELKKGDFVAFIHNGAGWGEGFQTGFIKKINQKTLSILPLYKVGKIRNPKNKYQKASHWNRNKYPREVIKISIDAAPKTVIEKFDTKQILAFMQLATKIKNREKK